MNTFKKYLKLIIGVAVIVLVVVVFFFAQKATDLENGNMKHWGAASIERRSAAVKLLIASDEHNELMVLCLDKVASLPDSGEMSIRDAASLCYTGIQIKDNI